MKQIIVLETILERVQKLKLHCFHNWCVFVIDFFFKQYVKFKYTIFKIKTNVYSF